MSEWQSQYHQHQHTSHQMCSTTFIRHPYTAACVTQPPSVCLPATLRACLPAFMTVCLFACLDACLSVCMPVCLPVYLLVSLSPCALLSLYFYPCPLFVCLLFYTSMTVLFECVCVVYPCLVHQGKIMKKMCKGMESNW